MQRNINCIKLCANIRKTTAVTFCKLKEAYGDESMSQTCVFESHEKFHGGQEHVQDDECLGRPSTSHTDAMLNILCRLSIRVNAEEVGILGKMTVRLEFQADHRSLTHHAHFSALHRCDSLRDDPSARRPVGLGALAKPYAIRKDGFVTRTHPNMLPLSYGKFSREFVFRGFAA